MGRKQNRYENYGNFTDGLKTNYPGIIVDVISAINRGSRVNPISIEKLLPIQKAASSDGRGKVSRENINDYNDNNSRRHIQGKIPLSKGELVERLVHITNRDRRS